MRSLRSDKVIERHRTAYLRTGYTTEPYALGNVNANFTPDLTKGQIQTMTLTGNITLAVPNATGYMDLLVTNNATNGTTINTSTYNTTSGTYNTTNGTKQVLSISSFGSGINLLSIVRVP